jgi:hypothetical protein
MNGGKPVVVRKHDLKERILERFAGNPNCMRLLTAGFSVDYTVLTFAGYSINRCCARICVQGLTPADNPQGRFFVYRLLSKLIIFVSPVFFTNETAFGGDGITNVHN